MDKQLKKVLIVTYYWPPSGGISVLRSLKIAKYLTHFGWEPIIYTVDNAQYPIIDHSNEQHIPRGITVLKQPCFEPFELYKKLTGRKKNDTLANVLNANDTQKGLFHQLSVWIRANFFIPDARSMWVKPSVKYLTHYLKNHPVDAIFSDGPPHTNTLIAAKVSKATNTPWLMDWQDPWTEVDYYKLFPIGKRADKKHHQLEQFCIRQASKITIVSPSWKKDIERLGAKNVSVVVWGFDEEDYTTLQPSQSDSFTISHMGLMGEDRNPIAFLQAVASLCAESPSFKKRVNIKFYGTIDNTIVHEITSKKLTEIVEIKSQVSRKEALETMMASDIQLLILNKAVNAKGRIPGKLFENLKSEKPILCLGPEDSDVQTILTDTNSGKVINHNKQHEIKAFILSVFEGKHTYKTTNLNHYSIKNLTGKIAELLNEMTAEKKRNRI